MRTRLAALLMVVGLGLLASAAWVRLDARAFQARGERRLEDPSLTASGPAPIGRIEIPRLGVRAVIAEGTAPRTLDRAVGHIEGTSLPGEPGNIGLAAHRDGLFRELEGVRAQDHIRLVTRNAEYRYRVEWVGVVEPRRLDLLKRGRSPELTLVTCYPFHVIGPAPKRFVVRAVPEMQSS